MERQQQGGSFISSDPPEHGPQRNTVQPAVAPRNLANLEPLIRERVIDILDNLPVGETFNWVDRVSMELTARMLATLFDFPYEDRRKLIEWSDITTNVPQVTATTASTWSPPAGADGLRPGVLQPLGTSGHHQHREQISYPCWPMAR